MLPHVNKAELIKTSSKRILIAAYGFEDRSTGWSKYQGKQGNIINDAIIVKYDPEKNKNKLSELRESLLNIGVAYPDEIIFNILEPEKLEKTLEAKFKNINGYNEVILDITALTKYLILIFLFKLTHFKGTLRIVYSEAEDYSPTLKEFEEFKKNSRFIARFPSQGFKKILRAKCLSSIRMQGQPVALVAFTSFNEQLVRYMLGTISPYRLIFINGIPPRNDYFWRIAATQFIHRKLIDDYRIANEIDSTSGLLKRKSSTLFYNETIEVMKQIYNQYGMFERIIVAATGSKMQTVGLFFSKIIFPDIHIEYPTPDSYFFDRMSMGTKTVHEIIFSNFFDSIHDLIGKNNSI